MPDLLTLTHSPADLFLLVLSALLINNVVLAQFLGLCPFMGVSGRYDTALPMGIATTFVLTLTAGICHQLNTWVLAPLQLEYLRIIAYIIVIAGTVQACELYLRATHRVLHQLMGIYLPLITTNCAVLAIALLATDNRLSFLQTLCFAAGAAMGFSIVLVLFAAIRDRLQTGTAPAAFRGVPLALISAGIMSLAFMGFRGLFQGMHVYG